MTTDVTSSYSSLVANGLAPLPFSFQAISADEVGVMRNGLEQVGGFSVAVNGDGTGTVTPLSSWGTDEITIFSKPDFEQPANFERFGPFYPDQMVPPLDRLARTAIALKDMVDRAPKVPIGETAADIPARALRAGGFRGWDAAGDETVLSGTGTDAAFRTDAASELGSTLLLHKMAGSNTYGRTLRQWGVVGGMGDQSVFNWIDSDLDADMLDGSVTDDVVEMVMAGVNEKSVRGGLLYFPRALYLLGAYSGGGVVTVPSNVALRGDGPASILKLKTGTNLNLVNIAPDAENVEIANLQIDGNCNGDVNNSAGTTLRSSGGDKSWLHHLLIVDSAAYGIGLEDGANRRLMMSNIIIDGTQADGIDSKNDGDTNNVIIASSITVRNFARNPLEATQTGIDARGTWLMDDIWIELPGADDAVGVRFRQGEVGDPPPGHGYGGHQSSLDNFRIVMSNGANQFGLNAVARGVRASNGRVINTRRGVYVQDSGFEGTNIDVSGASEFAFYLRATDGTLDADDSVLTACTAYDGATGFQVEADRCQLIGCGGEGNSVADVVVDAVANRTVVNGGDFTSTTKITDGGTNTKVVNVPGYQQGFTVAELGTKLTAPVEGDRALVTDITTMTWDAAPVGGGANKGWCTYSGGGWKIR